MSSRAKGDEALLQEVLQESLPVRERAEAFVTRLKRRGFEGSYELCKRTLELMRFLVNARRWRTAEELLRVVRALGRRLIRARPGELVVGNVVRRVLHLIKEEYVTLLREENGETDSFNLMPGRPEVDFSEEVKGNLRAAAVEGVSEMIVEIENAMVPICEQALDHIHSDETILVYGHSGSVCQFLKAARRKRIFRVLVSESSRAHSGHLMAKHLATSDSLVSGDMKIATTLIPDSNIFAVMARVNKVVIGTRAVMADGGILADVGTHMLALAAKHHSVPVICVTALYKLCPLFANDRDSFIDLQSPGETLSYADLGATSQNVQVVSPNCDHVPADLIDLFITNNGAHQPSYVYRLLSEHYTEVGDAL